MPDPRGTVIGGRILCPVFPRQERPPMRRRPVALPSLRVPAALLCLSLAGCGLRDARTCTSANVDPEAGIAACTRWLSSEGLDADARILGLSSRAMHATRLRAFDDAARDYRAAMHLRPGDADLPVWYGAVLGEGGDAAGALRAFDKALKLDPDHFAAHMNRGKVLADLQRFPEAAAAYDRAIALDPENGNARDGRCWVRAVIGADLPGALDDCDRAIAAMPGAGNPLNNRGFVHFRMGRMAESIADYTASIDADPAVASSYYVRSLARRAQGDAAAADRDLAEALRREPGVAARYAGYGLAPAAP